MSFIVFPLCPDLQALSKSLNEVKRAFRQSLDRIGLPLVNELITAEIDLSVKHAREEFAKKNEYYIDTESYSQCQKELEVGRFYHVILLF
jgi:hypothetical protein